MLAVRCKSGFKESDIKHIDLPEDNVDVVGRLLEYLYTGDYGSSSIATNDFANELASMYIIAEKYQVEQLKTLIIKKLQTVDWLSTPPATFFLVSQRIYAGTPDSDVPFREFFAKEAPLRTVTIGSVGFDDVFGVMSLGGSFAADCFKAQHRALVNAKARYKLSHQTVTTLEIMLKQSEQIGSASVTKQTMVEQRLNVLQARCENVEKLRKRCDADQVEHGVSLQKLRSDHEKWHLNCTHCG